MFRRRPLTGRPMSALGHKRTYALQQAMSALHPIATVKADMPQMVMSALHPIANMCSATRDVRFGPIADIWLSLDHLVGEQQEQLGKREAERLGRLKIDDEFKLDWRLHWQIARRLAFEDAINI